MGGVSASEHGDSDDEALEEESGDESDDSDAEPIEKSLLRDLDNTPHEVDGLSKRARSFFSQDIFQDLVIDAEDDEVDAKEQEEDEAEDGDELEGDEAEEEDADDAEAEANGVDDADDSSDDGIPSIAEQKKLRRAAAAASDGSKKRALRSSRCRRLGTMTRTGKTSTSVARPESRVSV